MGLSGKQGKVTRRPTVCSMINCDQSHEPSEIGWNSIQVTPWTFHLRWHFTDRCRPICRSVADTRHLIRSTSKIWQTESSRLQKFLIGTALRREQVGGLSAHRMIFRHEIRATDIYRPFREKGWRKKCVRDTTRCRFMPVSEYANRNGALRWRNALPSTGKRPADERRNGEFQNVVTSGMLEDTLAIFARWVMKSAAAPSVQFRLRVPLERNLHWSPNEIESIKAGHRSGFVSCKHTSCNSASLLHSTSNHEGTTNSKPAKAKSKPFHLFSVDHFDSCVGSSLGSGVLPETFLSGAILP